MITKPYARGGGGGGGGGEQQTIINSVILHIPFKVLAGTSLCTTMQALFSFSRILTTVTASSHSKVSNKTATKYTTKIKQLMTILRLSDIKYSHVYSYDNTMGKQQLKLHACLFKTYLCTIHTCLHRSRYRTNFYANRSNSNRKSKARRQ